MVTEGTTQIFSSLCVCVCVCVCVSYDSANFTYTVHLELNVTILTQAIISLNSINRCDFVKETGCVYFRVETKFLYRTINFMGVVTMSGERGGSKSQTQRQTQKQLLQGRQSGCCVAKKAAGYLT